MKHPALALLERGDITGLLELHRGLAGDATMTAPEQPPAAPAPTIQVPAAPPPPPAAPEVQRFTIEDIERARQQEKDKLYERLEQEANARKKLEEQMAAFNTDLQSRQQAEEEARKAAEKAAEEKRLAELSFGEKLQETEQRFGTQLTELQQQLAARDAILERERQFNELMSYRAQLLQQHSDDILPELHDLVAGNTREELDAAVSAMVTRSASILQQVAAATQTARQGARGVGVTAPPVGPMDNNSGYETVSAADIAAMDMQTYAQNRGRLLGAASQQQRDRGMFG
jgi:hypothetical protein